ncbi:MAG: hypothetical protein GC161_14440 [Planctomycetaceae bacterium]|nr:hypothetical protein [Planctomycetaceae bacterium]
MSGAEAGGADASAERSAARVEPRPGGAWLWVRAKPGARRQGVGGLWRDHLEVAVNPPAQDGRANDALLEVLGDALGLRAGALELTRGATSRNKVVFVPLAPDVLLARLRAPTR